MLQPGPVSTGPRPIPDLSVISTRIELTPAAISGFVRLADIWRLNAKQASTLIGEASERTWFRIKANEWQGTLSQDALTRISAMVGVYKGLHLLFADPLADEWVRKFNRDDPFNGISPLDHMIGQGIPGMLDTRGYVDALRGGL